MQKVFCFFSSEVPEQVERLKSGWISGEFSMSQIQKIQNDIRNKRFLESYIVLIGGIAILIADIFGVATANAMNEIILALLSALIYLTVLERREIQTASEKSEFEGINEFHSNRDSMVSLDKMINRARTEIVMYAVQHSTVIHQYLGLLKDKAESGCNIKILMMAAKRVDGSMNPNVAESESHRVYSGKRLLSEIEANARSFLSWLDSLSPSAQEKVEIRVYQECPTASYLFIDRSEIHGFVQVELFLYGVHVRDMPHYVIKRKDNERFFKVHNDSFEGLWKRSHVLKPDGPTNLTDDI